MKLGQQFVRNTGLSENVYAADFECATQGQADAYLLGIVEIYDESSFCFDTDIQGFVDRLINLPHRSVIYFHNLKYDYSYIYPECVRREMRLDETITGRERKIRKVRIFTSDKRYVELRDSSPLFAPSTIALKKVMASWCKDHTVKESVDFYATRPEKVSKQFFDYFREDVLGLAEALRNRFSLFPEQKTKLTTSSECKDMAKRIINAHFNHNKNFFDNVAFPSLTLDEDADLRRYYRGGFVWVNPLYKGLIVDNVKVFDVNSMYPSIMEQEALPYGKPRKFEGKPKYNPKMPLYVVTIIVKWAELKEGAPAFISNGRCNSFGSTEYVRFISNDDKLKERTLFLTNKEYEYFCDYYDYEIESFEGGWYFKARKDLFIPYIEKFRDIKETNTGAMREFAKLALNSPSGKWGQNPEIVEWESVIGADGCQKFVAKPKEGVGRPFYLPTSIFITSYARMRLVKQIIDCGIENCLYTDTDSLHVINVGEEKFKVHKTRFGYWDHEKTCEKARYLRQKRYGQVIDGVFHSTVAGIPERYLKQVCDNIEDFHEGLQVPCERMRMQPGGMMMKTMLVTV